MPKKKTTEQFVKEVSEILGDKYVVLGEYPGCHGKVPMKHLVCKIVLKIYKKETMKKISIV